MSEEVTLNNNNNAAPNSWFSGIDLKTIGIVAVLSSILGIGGGAGVVATKGVEASGGMSQDQADIRYQTKEEIRQFRIARDLELVTMKNELKSEIEKTLKKESFDIWLTTWNERQKNFDHKLDRILEK